MDQGGTMNRFLENLKYKVKKDFLCVETGAWYYLYGNTHTSIAFTISTSTFHEHQPYSESPTPSLHLTSSSLGQPSSVDLSILEQKGNAAHCKDTYTKGNVDWCMW